MLAIKRHDDFSDNNDPNVPGFPMDPVWKDRMLKFWNMPLIRRRCEDLFGENIHCSSEGCDVSGFPDDTIWKETCEGPREFFLWLTMKGEDRRDPRTHAVISNVEVREEEDGLVLYYDDQPIPPYCQRHHRELLELAFEADLEAYLDQFPSAERKTICAEILGDDSRDEEIPIVARIQPWVNAVTFALYVEEKREAVIQRASRTRRRIRSMPPRSDLNSSRGRIITFDSSRRP